jgi:hypothetical protein
MPNIDAFVRHGGPGQPIEVVLVRSDGPPDVRQVADDQAELMAIDLLKAARLNRQVAREPGSGR